MSQLIQPQKDLRKFSSKEKAQILQRFFKTGPGQYGEGDVFIGVKVPEIRQVCREHRDIKLPEVKKLVQSEIHEDRVLGLLILVDQFNRADEKKQKQIFDFYIKNRKHINNWDLVDLTAPNIVGIWLYENDQSAPLYQWVKSKKLWERRIAVLATFTFLRRGRYQETLDLCQMLLNDPEDLMHKASGWMLREMGKRDLKPLLQFLNQYAHVMPRTMLRYSIEKLSPKLKKKYMTQKGVVK